jgi:hypothetical protein
MHRWVRRDVSRLGDFWSQGLEDRTKSLNPTTIRAKADVMLASCVMYGGRLMRARAMREFFPVLVLRIEPTRAWAQSIPKRLEEGDSDLRTRISIWPVGVAVGLTSETRCCNRRDSLLPGPEWDRQPWLRQVVQPRFRMKKRSFFDPEQASAGSTEP